MNFRYEAAVDLRSSLCPGRLGFLGLLHMEVFNQRLEQEYNASVIVTAPTVPYKAVLSSAKLIKVRVLLTGPLVPPCRTARSELSAKRKCELVR